MNYRTRSMFYHFISKRDGEYCQGCRVLPTEKELVVDHKDNNNANNKLNNLQLLCKKCNYLKNPREPVDQCVSVRQAPEIPTEIEINRTKEPKFKEYLDSLFNEYDILSAKEVVNSSAQFLGLSPVTTRRYLDKECSIEGLYEMVVDGRTFMVKQKVRKIPSENANFEAKSDV